MNSDGSRKIRRILGGVVLLLVMVLAYLASTRTEEISVAVKDDRLSLTYSAGGAFDIQFKDIVSVTERQEFEPGQFVSGRETERYKFGLWDTPEFGEYHLAIDARVARYIVVETADQVYVINFESDDATHSFYNAFLELLQSQKAPGTP